MAQVEMNGEENPLLWVDVNEDFSDLSRFAGDGNVHYMMEYTKRYDAEPSDRDNIQSSTGDSEVCTPTETAQKYR